MTDRMVFGMLASVSVISLQKRKGSEVSKYCPCTVQVPVTVGPRRQPPRWRDTY